MTLTAIISIGQSSSALLILEPDRTSRAYLNLIWGYGGGRTPEGRANTLLTQNGYRRIGPWRDTPEGQAADVEATGETTACSCWLRKVDCGAITREADYHCQDHPQVQNQTPDVVLPF
jgi:hypothetical protein